MVGAIFALIFIYFVLPLTFIFFGKWLLAAMSILTGNKEALKDYGNLCERDNYSPLVNYHPYKNWHNRGERNKRI